MLVLAAAGLAVAAGVYLLPVIVAAMRHAPHLAVIVVINVFLGWSVLGWFAALVLSLWPPRPAPGQPPAPPPAGWRG